MLLRNFECIIRPKSASVQKNIDSVSVKMGNRKFVRLPAEDSKVVRFMWCMQSLLATLEAEANWGDHFRYLYDKFNSEIVPLYAQIADSESQMSTELKKAEDKSSA